MSINCQFKFPSVQISTFSKDGKKINEFTKNILFKFECVDESDAMYTFISSFSTLGLNVQIEDIE